MVELYKVGENGITVNLTEIVIIASLYIYIYIYIYIYMHIT